VGGRGRKKGVTHGSPMDEPVLSGEKEPLVGGRIGYGGGGGNVELQERRGGDRQPEGGD